MFSMTRTSNLMAIKWTRSMHALGRHEEDTSCSSILVIVFVWMPPWMLDVNIGRVMYHPTSFNVSCFKMR